MNEITPNSNRINNQKPPKAKKEYLILALFTATILLLLFLTLMYGSAPTSASPLPVFVTTDLTDSEVSSFKFQNKHTGFKDTVISARFWDSLSNPEEFIFVNNQQFAKPGPDNEVRLILQLNGVPVAQLVNQKYGADRLVPASDVQSVKNYESQLAVVLQQVVEQIEQLEIEIEVSGEFSYVFNGLALSTEMRNWERLEQLPQVKAVYPDYDVNAFLDDSVSLIGAPKVWEIQDAYGSPVTGEGIRVAVIDTGIDYTHPDLGGCFGPSCKVIGGYDFINSDDDPMDDSGHGTHVAGIVAANGVLKGVAPDATLYAYKVLDEYGGGTTSGIIAAIERATNPDGDPVTNDAVDIINMSLGGPGGPDDPLAQAVDAAVDNGVVVVVAAGNSGPGYLTVGSPGVAHKAFTVGATDKSDNIAPFSSRGPITGIYEKIKPDIVAPGVSISSPVPNSGQLGSPDRYLSLSGTSMAAPHIAGASALIKQLHPDWDPRMIKANLMNTAKDIGMDINAQGAGRVQVNSAATARAVVTPGSLGFGLVDVNNPIWIKTKTLSLVNFAPTSVNYSIQVSGTLPAGVTIDLDLTSVTLDIGESVAFTITLTVENGLLPYQGEEPFAYEGKVLAKSSADTLVIPFSFIKSPILKINFDEGPITVIVHDGVNYFRHFGNLWALSDPSIEILLPQGTYDVMVYYDGATRVIREGVMVESDAYLFISKSDAIYEISFIPKGKDGQTLTEGFTDVIWDHKNSNLFTMSTQLIQEAPIIWRISTLTDEYSFEWAFSTAFRNKVTVYDIYGYVNDGISSNIAIENKPSNFKHILYQYNPPPMVGEISIWHFLSAKKGYFSVGGSWVDEAAEPLTKPFTREGYLMPIPYPEFPFGFWEEVYVYNDTNYGEILSITPIFQAKNNQTFEGKLSFGCSSAQEEKPLFSTASDKLSIGLAPPHWFGRFENTDTAIRLRSSMGLCWNWLFLNQMQDLTFFLDLPYELHRDGTLVESGTLPGPKSSDYRYRYLEIPVSSPGVYTLQVLFDLYYIGDQKGTAKVTATFDTEAIDKNPPFFTALNILCDNDVADALPILCKNEIKLLVEDETSLEQVLIFYSLNGTSWKELSITNSGNEYKTKIPKLPYFTRVSLRVIALDATGNSLTYELNPAFVIEMIPPFLVSPSNGSFITMGDVEFSWYPVPGAASYRIQIDSVDSFDSENITTETVPSASYTSSLSVGTWYWRVLASDNEGNKSDYSQTRKFTSIMHKTFLPVIAR